ncbi:segregation and condensation protein A [Spelaeicoccus albus]|nr:ScpA family protein [Spelaeicoccus albus]
MPLTETDDSSALDAFEVHLENFSGPFDLLLGLIGKHQLDITEVALAAVTDEFIEYIKSAGVAALDETSQFLVVAATLLDLKAARLLPAGEVEDDEDIALLEARDLLFARLLQYRAFKDVASDLAAALENGSRRSPRAVPLEPQLAELLPDLVMNVTPDALAALAARALTPKGPAEVGLEHLHAPAVSVRDEAKTIVARLDRHEGKTLSFRRLVADADNSLVVVVRFLALLELYRDAAISFDQAAALGELTIRLRGPADTVNTDKFDEFDASSETADNAETAENADESPTADPGPTDND